MSAGSSSHIVSEAEIQAALAEAEAQATSIPSLDDGQSPAVVPIPVETTAPLRPLPREAPAPSSPPPPPTATATKEPATKGGTAENTASESATEPARWQRLYARIADVLYAAVDRVLWALNRPFEKLSGDTRQLFVLLAVVTMVVALTAACLLPRLWPPRDAVSQLTRQSAALQQAVEAPSPSDPQ